MKTTVEITDSLAREAKEVAARENVPVRELIETGLRKVLDERRSSPRFELRDAAFGGRGLQPEFRAGGWDRIREAVYEGHAG